VNGEALAAWLPSVTFSAAATRYEERMAATPIHGFTPGSLPTFNDALGQYGINAAYTIFDGGRREGKIRGARSRLEAANASGADSRQQLIATVIKAYLAVLSGSEILKAHDYRINAMQAELSRAEQFFAQEKAAKVEVLRVQAALAAAEAEQERARARLTVAEKNLASLIGMGSEQTLADHLVPVSILDPAGETDSMLYLTALAANPAIEQARRSVAAARADIAVARGARWPTLQLGGNWLDQGDFDGNRVDEWNVGATLSLPLFTGGSVKNRIAQSRAARLMAEEQLRLAELSVQREIDQTLAGLVEAQSRTASLSRSVESYAEVVRIEQLLVETGGGTQTDYLDAEAELVTVRAALAEARHAVIAARADLARLCGQLDQTWVSRYVENQR